MVTQCHIDFNGIKQYASDLQTFLGIKEIEVKIYENEQYLQSLIEAKSLEQLEIAWKVDPVLATILNSLKNFGSIEMKNQTSNLEFVRAKDKQAQLQVMKMKKTIDDVKLILQKEIIIHGNEVRGCCMSEEGDIFVIDYLIEDGLLTVVATDNKLKYQMLLEPSCGFDITLIDERTVAITSGNPMEKKGVDIIDIKKRRKIKFIELPGSTWGITKNIDLLYACVENNGIYKINTFNGTATSVISCNLPPCSYVSVFSDKVYYTNCRDNSIVCCDQNGSRVWTWKDTLVLKEPTGIAVDNNGNVYVVGNKSANVVIISSDGKHHKQILTKDDGLLSPFAIFIDAKNRKLLVANISNTAFVYDITYK